MSPTGRPSHTTSTQPPSAPVVTDDSVSVTVDSVRLQELRLRVHTLETALEEQEASLADAQAQLYEGRLRSGDLERVRLILEALRQRVSGDPEKESVLNRMEAALARLSASPRMHRPALPTRVAGTRAVSVAPPLPASLPEFTPPAPLATPHPSPLVDLPAPPPAPAPAEAATPDSEADPPRTVEPVPEEAVLPVPAPSVPATARGRRWRRTGSA